MDSVMPVGWQDPAYDRLAKDIRETDDFADVLVKLDAYIESQRQTPAEKRKEQQELDDKRLRDKKMMELRLQITDLRSKVAMGHEDAELELTAAQNQLTAMLMFG